MSNSTVKKILEVDDKFSKPLTKFKKGMGDVATASDKADKEVDEFNKTTEKGGKTSAKSAVDLKKLAVSAGVVTTAVITTAVAVGKYLDKTAEMADEVGKASQRMNMSIEFYQRMTSASGHAGTSITTTKVAMKSMLATMRQVEEGNVLMTSSYDKLGIELYDNEGKFRNQEKLFKEVIISLSDMENKTERNVIAQKMLGKAGSELAPLFNEGADAVRNYMEANDSAVTVSQEMANSSARYNDAVQTIQETMEQAKNNALEPFIDTMATLAEQFLDGGGIEAFKSYINDVGTVTQFVTEKVLELDRSIDAMFGIEPDATRLEVAQKELETREDIVANIKAGNSAARRALTQAELEPLRVAQERVEAQKEVIRLMNATPTTTGDSGGGGSVVAKTIGELKQEKEAVADVTSAEQIRVSLLNKYILQKVKATEEAREFAEVERGIAERQLEFDKMVAEQSTELRIEQREQKDADLEAEMEARREMVAQAIMSAGDIASAFASVSASKYNQIKKEYDYEEKRIKNSTMSETKKAKALEALAKKRKEAEIEQAKRQVAFAVMTGATNTALAIQNGILAITGVGANQPGGFAIKAGAMLAMAGVVATQIAQVKSAQAQIPQREHGGVMRKDELYEVAERNKDEVFQRDGKNYMMPSSGGRAIPNAGGGSTNITMNVSFGAGTNADDVLEVLPEAVASALEKADKQGIVQYSRMSNFQREIGN